VLAQEPSATQTPDVKNPEEPATAAATRSEHTENERALPDVQSRTVALLKSQYPADDLQELSANGESFNALWRKDQSGDAFGAVLLVPADGQTANWPHTIDVLRTELPRTGWGTLSIDIKQRKRDKVPSRPNSAEPQAPSTNPPSDTGGPDDNHARIEAAIEFLHSEGQYNIILAGYGNSAHRIVEYTASQQNPQNRTTGASLSPATRAIIVINGKSYGGGSLAPALSSINNRSMPIQDIVFGQHHLDLADADIRRSESRSLRFKKYFQLRIMEPSSTIFGEENRLSRRVRGFLSKHAKGVEINRR